MKKILIAFTLFLLMSAFVRADEILLKPYQKGDWSSILNLADGKPLAVHFWGVTCAPCVKEMPQWSKFLLFDKGAKVVFIQVDDVSPEMIRKMLRQVNLGGANNYYMASNFDERLRYEIDPKWRGETPITIFIDKAGKKEMTVGSVNFQRVNAWFKKNT
jgi:thiol-disulfide isomerase/thioredoxin